MLPPATACYEVLHNVSAIGCVGYHELATTRYEVDAPGQL